MKKLLYLLIIVCSNCLNAQQELFDTDYIHFTDTAQFRVWQTELGKWNPTDCQPLTSDASDERWQYNVYSDKGANGFSNRYTYYFDKGAVYRVVLASVRGDKRQWLDDNLKLIREKVKDAAKYRYYDAVSFKVVMVELKGEYYYWCEL